MSIERNGREFIPTCDICGDVLFPEDIFQDAVDAKKEAGWKSRRVNGEWEDVCDDCLREEDGI